MVFRTHLAGQQSRLRHRRLRSALLAQVGRLVRRRFGRARTSRRRSVITKRRRNVPQDGTQRGRRDGLVVHGQVRFVRYRSHQDQILASTALLVALRGRVARGHIPVMHRHRRLRFLPTRLHTAKLTLSLLDTACLPVWRRQRRRSVATHRLRCATSLARTTLAADQAGALTTSTRASSTIQTARSTCPTGR